MKIKELIEMLSKLNQDANIYVACQGYSNAFDDDNNTLLVKINKDNYVLADECKVCIDIDVEEVK